MVEALRFFKGKNEAQIESVAFETAMKAKGGISSEAKDLMLDSVPGTTFTGKGVLAYYYVSWSLYKPEFVGELGLDYAKEYEVAKGLI